MGLLHSRENPTMIRVTRLCGRVLGEPALCRVAHEPNRNPKPEPLEPFSQEPNAEPEPPEPFSRNRNRPLC